MWTDDDRESIGEARSIATVQERGELEGSCSSLYQCRSCSRRLHPISPPGVSSLHQPRAPVPVSPVSPFPPNLCGVPQVHQRLPFSSNSPLFKTRPKISSEKDVKGKRSLHQMRTMTLGYSRRKSFDYSYKDCVGNVHSSCALSALSALLSSVRVLSSVPFPAPLSPSPCLPHGAQGGKGIFMPSYRSCGDRFRAARVGEKKAEPPETRTAADEHEEGTSSHIFEGALGCFAFRFAHRAREPQNITPRCCACQQKGIFFKNMG